MDQLLQHLRNLGFTEMESKIMVHLSQEGASSGYEVSKRLGASRSNVYAVLQRLHARGFLHCSDGEPARYTMLPPEEFTHMISNHVRDSLQYVEQTMPMQRTRRPDFVTLQGDGQVMETLAKEIARAKHEIIIDLCADEASLFHDELKEAEERGVRLLWSCDAGNVEPSPFIHWQPITDEETQSLSEGRKFSFVIDRKWSLLGSRGDHVGTLGLVTEHPVMIRLLLGYFAQELIIYELEQDLGQEIGVRYGPHYEHVWNKYV
ncbi:TrmB family transcriptional regulator [Paenibacillus sp. Marseille-Q4541]|uniref:TrmB family transcriptional regulator n=1 Tax=Paenibacillus sp. Marseille-Q4541 TaxID=2831522 RepID=UPI001BAD8381|nr:TrmB family transcriptional regulator [Paenibacillus sp. Marseille-Q4541]